MFAIIATGRPPTPGQPYVVLIVDDEEDIREGLKDLLLHAMPTMEVFTAASGPEGLAFLRGREVDLILTDYKMPEMNGLQFLVEARKIRPETPRVLITAFGNEVARQAGAGEAADALFSKPVDPGPFLRSCQRMLAEGHA